MIPTYNRTSHRVSYVRAILKALGDGFFPMRWKGVVAEGTNECVGWVWLVNRERDMTFAASI